MFPDLLRDDIFQLETRRQWLRWPRASDAAAIAALAGAREVAEMTANIPHPYPAGAAADFILSARAANLDGKSLTLALTKKARPNEAIGVVELRQTAPGEAELGYWLGKPFWSQGLMTEAAREFIDLALRVGDLATINAHALPSNPASRRTLEKIGFAKQSEAVIPAPARGGPRVADHFKLASDAFGAATRHAGEPAAPCRAALREEMRCA